MRVTVDTAASRVLPTTDINLVRAATLLIPTLRSRSSETDALARLPGSTIADLEKTHLFDMLVPRMYGGLQCSLRTFMDVVVELGRGDGSAAWTVAWRLNGQNVLASELADMRLPGLFLKLEYFAAN
jgi:3-hydroxy-9,10-secoandrosta-1,3,5(10)-triene-9,17-dione monooxygenase